MIRQLNVTTSLTTFYCLRIHTKLAIHPGFVYEPIVLKPLFQLIDGYGFLEAVSIGEGVTYITVFNFPNKPTFELKNNDHSFSGISISR